MGASEKRRRRQDVAPQRGGLAPETARTIAVVALLALALLAFSNSFAAGFTLDNKGLLRDPRIVEATAHNISLIFRHSYWWPSGEAGLYRPFTSLTYLFNYAILGNQDHPAGYHWVNLLLHAASVVLVFFLVFRLIDKLAVSAFIAAIWAVHPVLTESVTNIVGRADLLAALSMLSGFLMYLKSAEATGRRRAAWLLGLMAVTTAGVFSKESAVCIVGMIALYELTFWGDRKRLKALLLGCSVTLIPIAVMLFVRSGVLRASLPAEFPFVDNPIIGASFWSGRLTAMTVIARYLRLIIWPAKLSADYSYPEIPVFRGRFGDWLSLSIVLALIVLAAFLYKRNRTAFFLIGFSAVTFLPTSNLLFPIGTIMAERFLYLPSIGLLACLVLALYAATQRAGVPRAAEVIACALVIAFTIRTAARNSDWRDDFSITLASLDASPNSFKLHRQMAELLFGAERTPENIQRGRIEAEKSIELLDALPDSEKVADVYCLAGGYYLLESASSGSGYERAIRTLQRCAAIDAAVRVAYKANVGPAWSGKLSAGDPQPYLMLALTYGGLKDVDRATDAAKKALLLHPRNPAAYQEIANIFLLQNRKEEAAEAIAQGVLLTEDPGLTEALSRFLKNEMGAENCVAVNPRCAAFRNLVCEVSPEVIQARIETNRQDLADEQRRTLVNDYGCSAVALDRR